MLSVLHCIMQSSQLYTIKEEGTEDCANATRCELEKGTLSVVFLKAPLRAIEELKETCSPARLLR